MLVKLPVGVEIDEVTHKEVTLRYPTVRDSVRLEAAEATLEEGGSRVAHWALVASTRIASIGDKKGPYDLDWLKDHMAMPDLLAIQQACAAMDDEVARFLERATVGEA